MQNRLESRLTPVGVKVHVNCQERSRQLSRALTPTDVSQLFVSFHTTYRLYGTTKHAKQTDYCRIFCTFTLTYAIKAQQHTNTFLIHYSNVQKITSAIIGNVSGSCGFREAGPLYETHCKPRRGAAVGGYGYDKKVPRSGTYRIFLTIQ